MKSQANSGKGKMGGGTPSKWRITSSEGMGVVIKDTDRPVNKKNLNSRQIGPKSKTGFGKDID